jgi:peptidyl-prolyl cis-trans isomerase C
LELIEFHVANLAGLGECPPPFAAGTRLTGKASMFTHSTLLPAKRMTLATAVLFALTLTATAQTPDPVVAKVNGVEVHQSDLQLAEEDIGPNLPQGIAGDAKRDYLISYMTDMILLAQEAEVQGMSATDAFKRRFAMMRNKVLMETLLQQTAQKSISDEAMHKVYDDAIKQMTPEEEVHARHILVKTEDEAKAVLADVKKGTDFAEVAKAKSTEPGADKSGGDLGYFTKEQMVPEFAEAAFKLDKGKVSEPVKTQFGWHIIKVEDKRKKPVPTYDQVKDQLETFVVRKAQSDLVAKLRTTAKIEKAETPAAPAPAAPAATPTPAAPAAAPTKK